MTLRFRFLSRCLIALIALSASSLAADKAKTKKSDKLTLEDVIFDAKYLQQQLGPKTLVAGLEETGEVPLEALDKAGIPEKTQIFSLPDEATKPVLTSSIAPAFPQSYRFRREPSSAGFLLFVGADGAVKSLFCHETNDQVYAIIAADALIKWRYTPAKIGGTAVPVLLPVLMKFSESDAANATFRAPKPPFSVQGNPTPPPPVRPGAQQSGPR